MPNVLEPIAKHDHRAPEALVTSATLLFVQLPGRFDAGLGSTIEDASAALETAYSLQNNGHINQVCARVPLLSISQGQCELPSTLT